MKKLIAITIIMASLAAGLVGNAFAGHKCDCKPCKCNPPCQCAAK